MARTPTPKIQDTTPVAAGTVVSAQTLTGLQSFNAISCYATLTGPTGGTLDCYIQTSYDGGTTWYDWAHFPQIPAAQAAKAYAIVSPLAAPVVPVAVGVGTLAAPGVALGAGLCTGAPLGSQVRAVYVSGVGTSAGAAQSILFVGSKYGI